VLSDVPSISVWCRSSCVVGFQAARTPKSTGQSSRAVSYLPAAIKEFKNAELSATEVNRPLRSMLPNTFAVKAGGGTNHRIGLYDAILLKENHIALAGGVKQALDQAHSYSALHSKPDALTAYEEAVPSRAADTVLPIQIEVRDERELREALSAGAEAVLLDNMTPAEAKQCVELARGLRPDCVVEISGGITLENVRAYAETGADFLSSGTLTHSAPAANLSLLVDCIEDQ